MTKEGRYQSLKEFYPFYLTEHQHPVSRMLHFTGTMLLFVLIGVAVYMGRYNLLWLLPVIGYGFAWFGHFFFEKNKPATFQYPLWSLASDFIMAFHILTGQIGSKMAEARQIIYGSQSAGK